MKALLGLLAVAALLGGCAQTVSETEVREDGTYTRKLTLTTMGSGMGEVTVEELDKSFSLPSGPEWSGKAEMKDGAAVWTGTTTRKAGETIQGDVSLMKKGKCFADNEVSVKEVEPGVFEYKETFRWHGKRPEDFDAPPKELLDHLKEALKGTTVTEAQQAEFAKKSSRMLITQMMGPGDPLLLTFLTQPEMTVRKLRARAGGAMRKLADEIFGDALTAEQKRTLILSALSMDTAKSSSDLPDPSAPPSEEESDDDMVSMTIVVKMPGRILETTGETDPITGEVYWGMVSEAAAYGDVVLYAKSTINSP